MLLKLIGTMVLGEKSQLKYSISNESICKNLAQQQLLLKRHQKIISYYSIRLTIITLYIIACKTSFTKCSKIETSFKTSSLNFNDEVISNRNPAANEPFIKQYNYTAQAKKMQSRGERKCNVK